MTVLLGFMVVANASGVAWFIHTDQSVWAAIAGANIGWGVALIAWENALKARPR